MKDDELKWIWKVASKYFPALPGETEESHKFVVQDSLCPGRISNQAPHEYDIRELFLHRPAR
jgi:hypothetical protein